MAAPYWGQLPPPKIPKWTDSPLKIQDTIEKSTQTEAPTISTQSPFASPIGSTFRGDGLAPRPPSFPYDTYNTSYDNDYLEKRRRRGENRNKDNLYEFNQAASPPAVTGAYWTSPSGSYQEPVASGPLFPDQIPAKSRKPRKSDGADTVKSEETNWEVLGTSSPISEKDIVFQDPIQRGEVTAKASRAEEGIRQLESGPDAFKLLIRQQGKLLIQKRRRLDGKRKSTPTAEHPVQNTVRFRNRPVAKAPEGGLQLERRPAAEESFPRVSSIKSKESISRSGSVLERVPITHNSPPLSVITQNRSPILNREIESSSIPQRTTSKKQKSSIPTAVEGDASEAAGDLYRSRSNRLRKDPPSDHWSRRESETDRNPEDDVLPSLASGRQIPSTLSRRATEPVKSETLPIQQLTGRNQPLKHSSSAKYDRKVSFVSSKGQTGPPVTGDGPIDREEHRHHHLDEMSQAKTTNGIKGAWREAGPSRKRSVRQKKAEAYDGEYDDSNAPTRFKPPLFLKCGPLLRYHGIRTEKTSSRSIARGPLPEREVWRGSVMIVTQDSSSSYELAPTLRLFLQPVDLLPPPPTQLDGEELAPEYIDPIAGLKKVGRDGRTLYTRPVEHLPEEQDLSRIETEQGLFESRRSNLDGNTDPKRMRNREQYDGEKAGKFKEVRGFRLHADRGVTFWRFNIEVELRSKQQRIAYRINRGPATGFWVPARGQSMNIMFYSCNGFTMDVHPNDFSGPDPLWRDVLNTHQNTTIPYGFGSYPDSYMKCPVMSGLGSVAFKYYMLFQQQSSIDEGEDTEPSWILGAQPGPYIPELSRSIFTGLGRGISFLGIDCRTERMNDEIVTAETYTKIFDRLEKDIIKGQTKHLIVLLGVPIAYPRMVWLETLLTSKVMTPIKAMGRAGLLGKNLMNHFDGGVEILDDLDDHWTAAHHKEERNWLIQELQDLAAENGDVHLGAIGQFYSNPKLKIPKDQDYRYMTNIISSAIVNAPPPDMLADILNKRNKVHHFDAETDEDMIPIFTHDVDGKPRNNKRLLNRRNWCSIREYNPSLTRSTSPEAATSYDGSIAPAPQRGLLRRFSSKGPSHRPDAPPLSNASFFNRRPSFSRPSLSLSRRNSTESARPGSLKRTLSLTRNDFTGLFRRSSKRRDSGGINGYGSDSEDNLSYNPNLDGPTTMRGGAGDEYYAFENELPRAATYPSKHAATSVAGSQPQEPVFTRNQFHRTPTGLSEKQIRMGNYQNINLEGGLDICLNVEVNQKDPAGITMPYRLLVPALWYEDDMGEEAAKRKREYDLILWLKKRRASKKGTDTERKVIASENSV
ncbi:hypothetical protein DID88_008739 [Monilinia fructigena]|uniref:PhoD-like phosphatase domain-containing protein n=1 Tax=Monilinia fructigena TaxID=38457 RepID=A0A395J677_9HELO|nr:hypothetical protein DID88_008739 [Monilinia fructigena]